MQYYDINFESEKSKQDFLKELFVIGYNSTLIKLMYIILVELIDFNVDKFNIFLKHVSTHYPTNEEIPFLKEYLKIFVLFLQEFKSINQEFPSFLTTLENNVTTDQAKTVYMQQIKIKDKTIQIIYKDFIFKILQLNEKEIEKIINTNDFTQSMELKYPHTESNKKNAIQPFGYITDCNTRNINLQGLDLFSNLSEIYIPQFEKLIKKTLEMLSEKIPNPAAREHILELACFEDKKHLEINQKYIENLRSLYKTIHCNREFEFFFKYSERSWKCI